MPKSAFFNLYEEMVSKIIKRIDVGFDGVRLTEN